MWDKQYTDQEVWEGKGQGKRYMGELGLLKAPRENKKSRKPHIYPGRGIF